MPRAANRLHWRPWERLRRQCFDRGGEFGPWRCERCGDGPPLELHHRDHDRRNNDPANLEALCPGCHIAEHDRLRGRPKAQAWRRMVRELTRRGM